MFDGRIALQHILEFLPHAIESRNKIVRVFEMMTLAASDQKAYDAFCSWFTHNIFFFVIFFSVKKQRGTFVL